MNFPGAKKKVQKKQTRKKLPNEPHLPNDCLDKVTLSKDQEFSAPSKFSLTTAEESSSTGVKKLKSKVMMSQATNDSAGIKMLIFRSLDDEGRIKTCLESEIKELKIRIQLREDWMKDLEKRLAASTSDNDCKESKITEQNTQLEEQNEMLVKRNEKIQFLEKQLSEVWRAADNANEALKQATENLESSLHQIEVKTSELETDIQVKDKLIHQLQAKVEELKNEVQTSKKFELEQRNDLAKKTTALGANISILKREINRKDQAYRRLEEENTQLNVEMKQMKSRGNEQVEKLDASLKEKIMELAKASEKIQDLENTINIMKDQQVIYIYPLHKFQFLTFHFRIYEKQVIT